MATFLYGRVVPRGTRCEQLRASRKALSVLRLTAGEASRTTAAIQFDASGSNNCRPARNLDSTLFGGKHLSSILTASSFHKHAVVNPHFGSDPGLRVLFPRHTVARVRSRKSTPGANVVGTRGF